MSTKGFWDNDFETVGDLIEHLQGFDKNLKVHVSTQAGGGITAALRETDDSELVVCFYGKNGGGIFNPPMTEDYYSEQRDKLLKYLSDSRYRCDARYHGGKCAVFKVETGLASFKVEEFNKLVVDRMRSEGLLINLSN